MSRPKIFKERASINIYFDKEELDTIGKCARHDGVSRGEFIREAMNNYLSEYWHVWNGKNINE